MPTWPEGARARGAAAPAGFFGRGEREKRGGKKEVSVFRCSVLPAAADDHGSARSSQALSGSLLLVFIHRSASSIMGRLQLAEWRCQERTASVRCCQSVGAIKIRGGDEFDDVEERRRKQRGDRSSTPLLFPQSESPRATKSLYPNEQGIRREALLPLQAWPSRHRRPWLRREKMTTTTMEELLRRHCCCCRCLCCRRRRQQQQSLVLLAPKRLDFRRRPLLMMTSQRLWRPRASRQRGQTVARPAYRGRKRAGEGRKESTWFFRSQVQTEERRKAFPLCAVSPFSASVSLKALCLCRKPVSF